ncbi:hypothetical protein [Virgibacillus sp. DJP39]|uniref:hypothetical protein n=1 Tax=Virgibacillus sp. DJP39 TaxID=3409790 RepID=UPI003BB50F32
MSQQDVDNTVTMLLAGYPKSIVKFDSEPIYINIKYNGSYINIVTDEKQDDDAFEVIKCMDGKECRDVIKKVERHYKNYTTVFK